jgi:hypothetical protein
MRKIILSAAVAVIAAASFAAPSQAGSYGYGHKKTYHAVGYKKVHCFIKKVKSYDYYGNVVFKKIKVCK